MDQPDVMIEDNYVSGHAELCEKLACEVQWDERIKTRKTASYGQAYNYSGITYANVPMHPDLILIVDRLEKTLGYRATNALLNYYENGMSSMGYHSDSEVEIVEGTGVAIISLGAERVLSFQSIKDKTVQCRFPMKGGSLLFMPWGTQQLWKHAVRKQENVGARISLTFRKLKP